MMPLQTEATDDVVVVVVVVVVPPGFKMSRNQPTMFFQKFTLQEEKAEKPDPAILLEPLGKTSSG